MSPDSRKPRAITPGAFSKTDPAPVPSVANLAPRHSADGPSWRAQAEAAILGLADRGGAR